MTPRQLQPLIDALTAQGHRHRILGLPVSDADEEQLEAALRAAVADEPTLRILHVAALDSDTAPSMRSLLRMQHRVLGGTRRLFRAAAAAELRSTHLGGNPRRATSHRHRHRVTGCRPACGDSVAPPPWSIRRSGVDWRIWLTATADEWSRLIDQVRGAAYPRRRPRSRCVIKRSMFPG